MRDVMHTGLSGASGKNILQSGEGLIGDAAACCLHVAPFLPDDACPKGDSDMLESNDLGANLTVVQGDILSVGMNDAPTVAADGCDAIHSVSRITCALCDRRVDRGVIECTAIDCPHSEKAAA